jgi:hypothetical protein
MNNQIKKIKSSHHLNNLQKRILKDLLIKIVVQNYVAKIKLIH